MKETVITPTCSLWWNWNLLTVTEKSGSKKGFSAVAHVTSSIVFVVTVVIYHYPCLHHRQNWCSQCFPALSWLGYVYNRDFTLCKVYEWPDLTFLLHNLVFWTLSTQAPCVPGILQFRKPKCCQIFQKPLFEKKAWTITHEKSPFLLGMDFLVKTITKTISNCTWRK
jgi:hypothetical protein